MLQRLFARRTSRRGLTANRRHRAAARHRMLGETLEPRSMLAVSASVSAGTLNIALGADGDAAILSYSGSAYTLTTGAGAAVTGSPFSGSGITAKVNVTGAAGNQSFRFGGSTALPVSLSVASTVEATTISTAINALGLSGSTVALSSPTITLGADILTAAAQTYAGAVLLAGSASLMSTGGAVDFERTVDRNDSVGFVAEATFAAGLSPNSVSIGDLNADGRPDLAIANRDSNSVSVLLNTTAPGATTPSYSYEATFATSSRPVSVSIGDLNGDGKPDLAIANAFSASVSVLLNTTAPGATTTLFSAQATFATGSFPYSVAIGDLNGDGKLDLAIANRGSDSVSVLLNTTAANATTPTYSAQATFVAGRSPYSISIGDLNGDGKPDLAIANGASDSVSVLLNTTAPGATTPSYSPQATFATGRRPLSVAIGDLNGDGKPDLAIANNSLLSVSVLLNTTAPNATAPSYSPQATFLAGHQPRSVSIGDLNGDGKPDLAIANSFNANQYGNVSVLASTMAPGATTPKYSPLGTFAAGFNPVSVSMGDLNGDGRPDLAIADRDSNSVSVIFNATPSYNLTVSSAAGTRFANVVGGTTPLTSLTIASGPTSLSGNVTTSNAQIYTGPVTLTTNTTLTGTTITTASAVAGAANSLTITGNAVVGGAITGVTSYAVSGTTTLGGGVTASGSQTYTGLVTLAANTILTGTTPTFTSGVAGNSKNLTLNFSGTTAIDGTKLTGIQDLTTGNGGSTTLAGAITTTGAQTYTGSVTLAADTTLTGTTITTGSTVTGAAKALAITGNAVVSGPIMDLTSYAVSGTTSLGADVTTSGSQTYTGLVTLAANTTLTGLTITTASTVNGTAKTLAITGNAVVGGAITDLTSYSVSGTTSLGGNVTTTGTQNYAGAVTLAGSPSLTSTTATVSFQSTVDASVSVGFATQTPFATGSNPRSVSIGDLNGDGKPDLAIANIGSASVGVLLNTTATGATAPSYSPQAEFATGYDPVFVAIGDLNGDGKPDLAVADRYSNSVSVFLNTTAPGATAPSYSPRAAFATGSDPVSVSIGDLNGDGKPDLAVANANSELVSVLLNTMSAGATAPSYTVQATFAAGASPRSVSIGDLNGDGKPDLAVANSNSRSVSVLLNTTATGALMPSYAAQATFAAGSSPFSVSIGDLNGDGKPDLAIANLDSRSVSVLLNTTAPGATAPSFAFQATFTTGTGPYSVSIGDLNGDGKPDLAIANDSSNSVSVLLNTTAPGATAPSYASQATFTAGTGPRSVSIGDLNGDGKPDLAIANTNSDSVSVLLNASCNLTVSSATGTTFAAAVGGTTPLASVAIASGPTSLGGNVTTTGTQTYAGAVTLAANTTLTGSTITTGSTVAGAAKTLAITGDALVSGAITDLTSYAVSGKTSLGADVTTSGSQTYTGLVTLAANTILTGTVPTFTAGVAGNSKNLTLNFSGPTAIDGAKFTGIKDLTTGNGGTTALAGAITTTGSQIYNDAITLAANTTLTGTTITTASTVTGAAKTLAITGNAVVSGPITDLTSYAVSGTTSLGGDITTTGAQTYMGPVTLVGSRSLTSTAGEVSFNSTVDATVGVEFAGQSTFATGRRPYAVSIGDLNGDGKPDLTTANVGTTSVSVLLNTTALGATTPSYAPQATFTTGNDPWSISIGDVNGDGMPDLAIANWGSDSVSVLLNTMAQGASTPSYAPAATFASGSKPFSVAIGDMNGDGKPDLVIANSLSNSVSVLLNTTAPGATTPSYAAQATFATGQKPCAVSIGDINDDGRPDLVIANFISDSVSVLLNATVPGATTPSYAPQATFATGRDPQSVSISDVDNDGKPDLVFARFAYYSNSFSVLLNTTAAGATTPSFSTQIAFATGNDPNRGAVGDLNGDFKPDLAVVNFDSNSVSVLLNTTAPGDTAPAYAPKTEFSTGFSPRSVSIGDVNGDDMSDLAIANWGSDSVSVLLNNTPSVMLAVSSAGGTRFADAVGSLAALTSLTIAAGPTSLGGDVTTTGMQKYNGAVTLTANAILTGTNLTFNADVAGNGKNLTLNFSGPTAIDGATFTGIKDFATGNGGTTTLAGAITTMGSQTYNDAVTLAANTTLTGTAPKFGAGVAGNGKNLTLNFSGPTAIDGAKFTGIRDLATGNGGTTTLAGAITTTGTQTYNDAVTLAADTAITTAGSPVSFAQAVDGGKNLTIAAGSGAVSFATAVGGSSPLGSLWVSAAASVTAAAEIALDGAVAGARPHGLVLGANTKNVTMTAAGSTIRNFGGYGIILASVKGSSLAGFLVSNNAGGGALATGDLAGTSISGSVFKSSPTGVLLSAAKGLTIGKGNYLMDGTSSGLAVYGDSQGSVVTGSVFYNNATGILLSGATDLTIDSSSGTPNTIQGNTAQGVLATGTLSGTSILGASIYGNPTGILMSSAQGLTVGAGNYLQNNSSSGLAGYGDSAGSVVTGSVFTANSVGIILAGATNLAIDASGGAPNTIVGNTAQGVVATGTLSGTSIRGASVYGNPTGIFMSAAQGLTIGTGNYLQNSSSAGLAVYGDSAGSVVTGSVFAGNVIGAIVSGARNLAIDSRGGSPNAFVSNTAYGIYADGACDGTVIAGSTIAANPLGVVLSGAKNLTVNGGNSIFGNTNIGVFVTGNSSGTKLQGNVIDRNVTGLLMSAVAGLTVGGAGAAANTIANSVVSGVTLSGACTGSTLAANWIGANGIGITLSGASGATISGASTVAGNKYYGLYASGVCTGTSFTGGVFTANDFGFVIVTAEGLSISGATVVGHPGHGLWATGKCTGTSIVGNMILGNGTNIETSTTTAGTFQAS